MIKIKRVRILPTEILVNLGSWATMEFKKDLARTQYVLNCSSHIWIGRLGDEPLFAAGLIRTSSIGTGNVFWFLGCHGLDRNFTKAFKGMVRANRRLMKCRKRISTYIAVDFRAGARFAKFFGFEKIGEDILDNGVQYNCYRLEA